MAIWNHVFRFILSVNVLCKCGIYGSLETIFFIDYPADSLISHCSLRTTKSRKNSHKPSLKYRQLVSMRQYIPTGPNQD